jgi:hypothetical protein
MSNIYQEHGYNSRKEYLESLADEYGISLDTVLTVADMYGETEDFDGLISACADAEAMGL